MKYNYPENTPSAYAEYHRVREGPNGILVYYKNTSQFVSTSKELRNIFGTARYTDSVKAMSKWADEMIEKYEGVSEDTEGRADTSFASQAILEDDSSNSRMIT